MWFLPHPAGRTVPLQKVPSWLGFHGNLSLGEKGVFAEGEPQRPVASCCDQHTGGWEGHDLPWEAEACLQGRDVPKAQLRTEGWPCRLEQARPLPTLPLQSTHSWVGVAGGSGAEGHSEVSQQRNVSSGHPRETGWDVIQDNRRLRCKSQTCPQGVTMMLLLTPA